jgi:hypothetical protein
MSLLNARFGAGVAVLALVVIQAAHAADTYPIKYNAADQAAARAITLKLSDLGAGWKGGPTKPDLSNDTCPTKRSDLVLTGAAKSEFQAEGVFVSSESAILRTAGMVRTDWQRTVANPEFWACGRREMAKIEEAKLVSLKKIAFPKLATYSARYRMVYDYGTAGKPALVLIDVILVGRGRSEITLMVSAPYVSRAAADGAGRRLASILVGRIRA